MSYATAYRTGGTSELISLCFCLFNQIWDTTAVFVAVFIVYSFRLPHHQKCDQKNTSSRFCSPHRISVTAIANLLAHRFDLWLCRPCFWMQTTNYAFGGQKYNVFPLIATVLNGFPESFWTYGFFWHAHFLFFLLLKGKRSQSAVDE